MKFLRFYIVYRLPISIALIVIGIISHLFGDPILAWILYFLALISLVLYFTIGTMRMVQEAVSEGDVDGAVKYIKMIKFPRLLFKPIRASYYMMQSNLSIANADLNSAEANIRKSLNTKSSMAGEMEGTNLMQLGFIQLKQGKGKEGRLTLIEAVKKGIPDKENLASVYLQLCTMEIQRQNNKVGKEYFKKAKALKPKSEEIVKQLQLLEKNIARIPG